MTTIDKPAVAGVIERLKPRFGERITTQRAAREAHGRGEGLHDLLPPTLSRSPNRPTTLRRWSRRAASTASR
ncbi:hypothetical protein [Novosphingobium sp. Gsoil 351]|uniref:hypothetical protein n=1 Tax=Novosphingobium sp. Gsoil 351 TaxID=2675225 RepID=UPI001E587E18|nr:hypothetical protein [Novosphingobium sp. Gsoil 351]